jgi:RHS repeat-associated protein
LLCSNFFLARLALVETVDSSGGVVVRYTQGLSIDDPLAMQRSNTTDYYEADGLGSITSLTTTNGSVAQTYTYDCFGNITNSSGSLTNFFRYTAREFDTETSLYYYRARYYDPNPGRFIGEDPSEFATGINFYVYVENHSTDLIDPTGPLQVCCRDANLPPIAYYASKTLQPTPCHCFLKLSDGTTLGGYHSYRWILFSGSLGSLVLRPNDGADKNNPKATCTPIPGGYCQTDGAAKRAFKSLGPTLGGYGFASRDAGTSNDAAATILQAAGISYTLPTCAWGKEHGLVSCDSRDHISSSFPSDLLNRGASI